MKPEYAKYHGNIRQQIDIDPDKRRCIVCDRPGATKFCLACIYARICVDCAESHYEAHEIEIDARLAAYAAMAEEREDEQAAIEDGSYVVVPGLAQSYALGAQMPLDL